MKIPDRWRNYSNAGTVIEATPFIAFKTPLRESFNNNLPETERFTLSMVAKLHPKLTTVVDLTCTNRYYKSSDLKELGIKHVKILVPGKCIPPEQLVTKFFETADKFREQSKYESKENVIGVHCTHGLNRTGYFVCRYLVQRMGLTPQDAIEKFEKARGHKMERDVYIQIIKSCIPGVDTAPDTSAVDTSSFKTTVTPKPLITNWRTEPRSLPTRVTTRRQSRYEVRGDDRNWRDFRDQFRRPMGYHHNMDPYYNNQDPRYYNRIPNYQPNWNDRRSQNIHYRPRDRY